MVTVAPRRSSSAACSCCAVRVRGVAVNEGEVVEPAGGAVVNVTSTSGSPTTPVSCTFFDGAMPTVATSVSLAATAVPDPWTDQLTVVASDFAYAWQYQVVPS